jgi:hypothetical protein
MAGTPLEMAGRTGDDKADPIKSDILAHQWQITNWPYPNPVMTGQEIFHLAMNHDDGGTSEGL